MSPNGIKFVTFGVNFHSDACSEHPRVLRNVTQTCHKTSKRFRAYTGSENTPVQSIHRFRAYAGSEMHRFRAYAGSEHTPVQSIHRFRAYTGSEHTPVQSIHRIRDPSVQSIRWFRDPPVQSMRRLQHTKIQMIRRFKAYAGSDTNRFEENIHTVKIFIPQNFYAPKFLNLKNFKT